MKVFSNNTEVLGRFFSNVLVYEKPSFQYWKNGFSVLGIFGTFTHELINYTTIEGIDQLYYH